MDQAWGEGVFQLQEKDFFASETGWNMGPFAAMLQSLHLYIPHLEPQNTKKLQGTKINSAHTTEANFGAKDPKTLLKIRVQNTGSANVPPAYNTA